ncbi:sodium/calcium exchanger ncl [Anaeramoeba flamelloides]|uniref:Sodium/calcium exchanger ncl n=1 Tax=Anaeramoeba flamelloides TaxID=1746091 RepID=A0AAV7ZIR3_9EUKA|nr:sodium/calcium exchanger ncl [Anaeramoeba flamelloides]
MLQVLIECSTSNNFPCSTSVLGNIILMVLFGIVITYGSKILADGSDLLTEVINPGLVGGTLLPVLGALPDSIIIFVACLGGTKSEVQKQVSVGVGTLAGSTIMLLTISFFLSILVGRCDLDKNGNAKENECNGFSLTKQGITTNNDCPTNAKIMMLLSLVYLIIQGPAFAYLSLPEAKAQKKEKAFALAGFVCSLVCLIGYCVWQVLNTSAQEKKFEQIHEKHKLQQVINMMVATAQRFEQERLDKEKGQQNEDDEETPLVDPEEKKKNDLANMTNRFNKWKQKAEAMKEEEENDFDKGSLTEIKVTEEDQDEEEKNWTPKQIWTRASLLMLVGIVIVSFFSDPLVTSIEGFANSIKISPFFVSFVISPFASNSSELIASLMFCAKKKKTNISMAISALYGAASMNATMCLSVFLIMIYIRKLAWEYSAEILSILVITVAVGIIGLKKTIKVWVGFVLVFLYFFAIGFVAFLESSVVGWR